ncbi:MAG: hypothetical protein HQ517_00200 [SAR324 cluster bacterium]|nr:hypothetical protein [SAR324 cluster bacterium]
MLATIALRSTLSDIPTRITQLKEHYQKGDIELVHRLAHTINPKNGSSGYSGLSSSDKINSERLMLIWPGRWMPIQTLRKSEETPCRN